VQNSVNPVRNRGVRGAKTRSARDLAEFCTPDRPAPVTEGRFRTRD
jgi:hypothetical protein